MWVYLPYIPKLPSEYQEVEYIESSGTQVLRIGSSWNSNYKTEAVMQITGSSDVLYGIRNTANPALKYWVWWDSSNGYRASTGNGTLTSLWVSIDNNKHSYILYNWSLLIDGTSYTVTNTSNVSYSRWLPLFWYCSDADNNYYAFSSLKMFSFKAYNWSTLLYDLVPCYRKSDSVIWMYDLVNSVFYTNQWTGTFSKGNDVTMVEMKNAYIGEVWTPWSNTIAYFPLAEDQLDKSWNWYILTTAGTKQTIWYQFSWSDIQINWTSDVANMMSVRIKIVSFGSWIWDSATMIRIWGAMRYNWYHITSSSNKKFQIYNSSSSSLIYSSAQNTDTWNRYHLLLWVSWTTNWNYVWWINWNKVFSWTTNTNLWWWDWLIKIINNNTTLIASDLIVENRVRTDAEVLNYYNNTKSNYWL